jgi:hypothetical protein
MFRCWPGVDGDAAFMSSWLSEAVGIGLQMGYSQWRPVYEWAIGRAIAETNGTSGWNRQWPMPYKNNFYPSEPVIGRWRPYTDVEIVNVNKPRAEGGACDSWADAWAWYVAGCGGSGATHQADGNGHPLSGTGGDPSQWDGHTLLAPYYDSDGLGREAQKKAGYGDIIAQPPRYNFCGYFTFFTHRCGELAIAARLHALGLANVPEARACYDYISGETAVARACYGSQVFGEPHNSIVP